MGAYTNDMGLGVYELYSHRCCGACLEGSAFILYYVHVSLLFRRDVIAIVRLTCFIKFNIREVEKSYL